MSFLSFLNKPDGEISFLLDIGNGSITGAVVLFKKNTKPEFLYSIEVPFVVPEKPNASKLVDDMVSLLNTLIAETMKQGFRHPYWKNKTKKLDGALISFSSPWFVSKTKHLSLEKESAFIITESFINDITNKEEEAFKKEISANAEETADFKVVEKSIVHTKINGYTLESSIGKKTKSLDAYLYMSIISGGIISKVEDILLKSAHIPKNKMFVHTFPLISFTVIRDVFSASSDFIILDVTGEVTDITLVSNDVIQQSATIPSGRNFLIRQIMKSFGVNSEIAASTLLLFTEEKLGPEDAAKMEAACVDVEKEWSIYIENGLSELSPNMVLPGNVYFTADDDVAGIYMDFLKLEKTDSTAMFRKGMNLTHLGKENTSDFFTADSTIKTNEFAAILAIFYNKIYNS